MPPVDPTRCRRRSKRRAGPAYWRMSPNPGDGVGAASSASPFASPSGCKRPYPSVRYMLDGIPWVWYGTFSSGEGAGVTARGGAAARWRRRRVCPHGAPSRVQLAACCCSCRWGLGRDAVQWSTLRQFSCTGVRSPPLPAIAGVGKIRAAAPRRWQWLEVRIAAERRGGVLLAQFNGADDAMCTDLLLKSRNSAKPRLHGFTHFPVISPKTIPQNNENPPSNVRLAHY